MCVRNWHMEFEINKLLNTVISYYKIDYKCIVFAPQTPCVFTVKTREFVICNQNISKSIKDAGSKSRHSTTVTTFGAVSNFTVDS